MNFYETKLISIKQTIGNCKRILAFDLETLVRNNGFLERERIIAISITTSDNETRVLVAENDSDAEEYRILSEFNNFIAKFNPEVITGFNHAAYDIPLIYTKLVKLSYSKMLWDLKFFFGTSFLVDIMYACAMDLMPVTGEYKIRGLKKVLELERYSGIPLEKKKELVEIDGMNKGEAIEMLWKTDRKKFIQYCEGDTKDVLSLYKFILGMNKK
ncbi:MAG: 3'-5' exonuclease [Thermoplasmataceae archaeon]